MTQIKPLKNVWVCVDDRGNAQHYTIRLSKSNSIEKLLMNSNSTWKEAKSYGWKCVKVNLEIKQI